MKLNLVYKRVTCTEGERERERERERVREREREGERERERDKWIKYIPDGGIFSRTPHEVGSK